MKKERILSTRFFGGLLLALCCFLLVTPAIALANDSVFDCIEDEKNCEEENDQNSPTNSSDNIDSEDEQGNNAPVGLTARDYIKTLFALAFVIALLYALLKFMNRKNRINQKNQLMKNLGGISLGQQKSIQLVVIGSSYYLVSVGDDIRLLKEITDEAEIDLLLEHYEEVEDVPFVGLFEKMLTKFSPFHKKEEVPTKNTNEEQDFSDMLHGRLREIKDARKSQIHRLTDKERDDDA